MNKILCVGIVGHLGVVGRAMTNCITSTMKHYFLGFDIKCHKPEEIRRLEKCDIVFVCVPTLSNDDGSCDTSIVEEVVNALHKQNTNQLIVIRSTVAVGTTDWLCLHNDTDRIVYWPEFLRERCAEEDFLSDPDIIIGANSSATFFAVEGCLKNFMPKNIKRTFHHCTPSEAEACKYMHNTFNAMKITFANSMHDFLEKADEKIRYNIVSNLWQLHAPKACNYITVQPGKLHGFGGPCLPKDVRALEQQSLEVGSTALYELMKCIRMNNQSFPTTVWSNMRNE